MSALEIRLAIYVGILILISGSVLYGNYERERANSIVAKDQAARSAQDTRDLQLAQDTIRELRNALSTLQGAAPAVVSTPAPHIRVCVPTGNVRPEVAAGGTQPGSPNAGVSGPVLPVDHGGVSGEGADIGSGVRDLARADVLLATYRSQLWDWSVKQAQPAPPH